MVKRPELSALEAEHSALAPVFVLAQLDRVVLECPQVLAVLVGPVVLLLFLLKVFLFL